MRDEKPFTSTAPRDESWRPLFDGKHVGRYQLLWKSNNWIHYGEWLAAPRDPACFVGEKILIRKITGKTLLATYVPDTSYCNTLLFVLKRKEATYSYKSILAVLSSSLIGWYFRKKLQIGENDTFPQIMIRDILQFPFPRIEAESQAEIDKLVEMMLRLHQALDAASLPEKAAQLKHRINATDRRIDELVSRLYGLTKEEIQRIGEG